MDEALIAKLAEKLHKEDPTPEIFDDIQRKVNIYAPIPNELFSKKMSY